MIVLDEQLLGRGVEREIAAWYPGAIQFITDLRPNTVIKDDAIPGLLRQQDQPIFVTINERDFWRQEMIGEHYCIICFALPDARAWQVPSLLRVLLRRQEFNSKARRPGKIIRVTDSAISYYTTGDRQTKVIVDWKI